MVKVRTEDRSKLTDFKVLTFDVYSTLIDEPGGMHKALTSLLAQLPDTHPLKTDKAAALDAFSKYERELQVSKPTLSYNHLLSLAYKALASSLSLLPPSPTECEKFASSIPNWPAFPDTVAALHSLSRHYKLVILSNIDNVSISQTLSGPLATVPFAAVYTAENIGSYKPSLNNFHYLVEKVGEELGIKKEEILHTANSLRCDHVPAKRMGLSSVWIDRGEGEEEMRRYLERGEVGFTWRFRGMGDMAVAVDDAFEDKGK